MASVKAESTIERKYLTVREASRYSSLSISALYRHIEDERLRAYAPGGGKFLIAVEDLEAFIRGDVAEDRGESAAWPGGRHAPASSRRVGPRIVGGGPVLSSVETRKPTATNGGLRMTRSDGTGTPAGLDDRWT